MTTLIEKGTSNVAPASADNCIQRVKCVLVGDGAVGKTSLVIGYTTNGYPKEYMPTAYDKYSVIVNVNYKPIQLQICDTAGQDDFDALRPLCYPHTDVFLLCFSVVYPTSFYNIFEKWIYEVRHYCPKVPIVLVGTQSDLRTDINVLIELAEYKEEPVSVQQAKHLAAKIGAVAYIECSAMTQRNLKEVFDTALMAALRTPKFDSMSNGVCPQGKSNCDPNHKKCSSSQKRRKKGLRKLWCFS
ncbi:rho-related GTP-binding protein RhoU-like [Argiope bruennichi]|uniref:Rho-related GTP-binding protein RhoU like protein n=1 Tax=Argiope bruennichi TaxID=94029 RepID=A0A8T0ERL6_ARGBR|nr:rho-related GTP-binding protein RhoU-like [Argiope bruennichi]KAF8777904.1 Rho-related GTP-binding protein RhoU like protein [Argiope bruennichi]